MWVFIARNTEQCKSIYIIRVKIIYKMFMNLKNKPFEIINNVSQIVISLEFKQQSKRY